MRAWEQWGSGVRHGEGVASRAGMRPSLGHEDTLGWVTLLLASPGTWQRLLLVLLKPTAGSAETRFVNSDYI